MSKQQTINKIMSYGFTYSQALVIYKSMLEHTL